MLSTISVDQFFDQEKECVFKDEQYSVRNNGAILRHPKDGRHSKLDNEWTFGKQDKDSGYMLLGQVRVHHVVATAFIGECPGSLKQYVVDHIDNNKCNNRPENLRWCTRLENSIGNPITRAKIELICGSIEAFIENPSLLAGHESENPNFSWMRAVSPAEARASYNSWLEWSQRPVEERKGKGGAVGEWIYGDSKTQSFKRTLEARDDGFGDGWGSLSNYNKSPEAPSAPMSIEEIMNQEPEHEVFESLTPTALQVDWKTPGEFCCCPLSISESPIEDYLSNLQKGKVYTTNQYGSSTVHDFAVVERDGVRAIYVVTKLDEANVKDYAMSHIVFEDGHFYHYSDGTFFEEAGVMKAFTEEQGLVWEGEDSIDNYM